MTTVALIGPDGAGKSTLSALLQGEEALAPLKRVYMGVNLEASGPMLPLTRLVLARKRRRGRRPDMTATSRRAPSSTGPLSAAAAVGRRGLRMAAWMAEEWYRQAVALVYEARGAIVVFDRHFAADYYRADAVDGAPELWSDRVHRFVLRHLYPEPDLVICLDAPGSVLFERKGEADPVWLESRRQGYLQFCAATRRAHVVDATRPLDDVRHEVVDVIRSFHSGRVA